MYQKKKMINLMKYSKMLNTIPAFKGLFKTCLFFRENFITEVIIGEKLAGPGDKNSLKH